MKIIAIPIKAIYISTFPKNVAKFKGGDRKNTNNKRVLLFPDD